MTIEPFRMEDITPFLKLAAAEGWVAEPWEFEFLQGEFPQGCFAARDENGETAGYVTSLCLHLSGWIGNLLVAQQFRGGGIGKVLFRKALEALRAAGAQTIWLTASKSGTPLYEKHEFKRIDTIVRWVGTGRQRHGVHVDKSKHNPLMAPSHNLDTRAWGDRRDVLLKATSHRGQILQNESGFIVQQPCGEAVQFGPFASLDTQSAVRLFDEAVGAVAVGTKIFLDVPRSNSAAARHMLRRGMQVCGSNELMYAGTRPDYRPELLYGLATMGSCG
ncbi:MAG: GNAT family N-acetyltransferase [Geobacteraceae bacterium]|nr:GNAT family N-acetyltransferase [Geobacteraceae bacterium]NTW79706.1 GNAT family N-acetyltransferase [Geobacteraceae bacterium]